MFGLDTMKRKCARAFLEIDCGATRKFIETPREASRVIEEIATDLTSKHNFIPTMAAQQPSNKRHIDDTEPESKWEDFEGFEESSAKDSEGRFWVMTVHQNAEGSYVNFPASVDAVIVTQRSNIAIKYLSYQEERCPKTGRCHLQLFMITKDKVKHSTLRKNFPKHYIAMRYKKATNKQADEYTKKKETATGKHVYQGGEFEDDQSGKRTDLQEVLKACEDGATLDAIVRTHGSTFVKYPRGILLAKKILQKPDPNRKVEVVLFTGPTGTGKTSFVKRLIEMGNNSVYVPEANNSNMLSFEEYDGEQVISIEELSKCAGPSCQIPSAALLKLCDNGAVKLMGRGQSCHAKHSFVYITSNFEPDQWGMSEEHLAAFLRRVNLWMDCDYKEWTVRQCTFPCLPPFMLPEWSLNSLHTKWLNLETAHSGFKFVKPATRSTASTSRGFILWTDANAKASSPATQQPSTGPIVVEDDEPELSQDFGAVELRRNKEPEPEFNLSPDNSQVNKTFPFVYDLTQEDNF